LQVLGAAFNDNAAMLIPNFVQQFQVGFPVGSASADSVLAYLGFGLERYVVPQVAVIDRKGNIRAQTPAQGDPNLQMESYMRNLLDELLKEGAAAPAHHTTRVRAHSKTTASVR
ncbi:MAG: TlpA family protein disulfide reductase, partial [Bryobacteraceae bacterium]